MDMLVFPIFHCYKLTIIIQVYASLCTYFFMTFTNVWNFWFEKYGLLILVEIAKLFSKMIKI